MGGYCSGPVLTWLCLRAHTCISSFVIDPGFVKQKTYNPEKRMESLVVVPISQVAGACVPSCLSFVCAFYDLSQHDTD